MNRRLQSKFLPRVVALAGSRHAAIPVSERRTTSAALRWAIALRPLAASSLVLAAWLAAAPARALTPESPEVRQLIDRAVTFLERPLPLEHSAVATNNHLGAKALVGLAMLKAGRGADHPKVKEALAAIQQAQGPAPMTIDIYNTGAVLLFLSEVDPVGQRGEMEKRLQHLLGLQLASGAWDYHPEKTGDTSVTQYGVLGLWAADNAGIPTPLDAWERAANWLLRVQDPSGAWGYQAVDPGSFNLVKQKEVRHSLAAAGLGSLYICDDHLLLSNEETIDEKKIPDALKPVRGESSRRSTNVDPQVVATAKARGNEWFKKNYEIGPEDWTHYYLYALERYESFRELSEGEQAAGVNWYDDGVEYLRKTQKPDGSWQSPPYSHIVADTCFSILFLTRSTQKSIEAVKHFGSGTLAGGRGLPADGEVALGGGRTRPLAGPAEELLAVMKDPLSPEFAEAVEGLNELALEADKETLNKFADQLRTLAGGDTPESRVAALRALSRTQNFDHVPLLIEALKDPNPEVFHAADEGLRFMSRKLLGADLENPDDPTREAVIEGWKAWFRSIRPSADLPE